MSDVPTISLKRRAITSLVLCAVLLAIGVLAFRFLKSQATDSEKAPSQQLPEVVRVQQAERTSFTETLRGFGKANALRHTTVAAEVVGLVDWVSDTLEPGVAIEFEVPHQSNGGGRVDGKAPPGPAVVHIDARDLEDRVERAAAEVAGVKTEIARLEVVRQNLNERLALARLELEAAQREYERIEKLVETKRLARGELDKERLRVLLRERSVVDLESSLRENESAVSTLEERTAARLRELRMAERNLTRAQVHVPTPGIIEERHVTQGDRVALGSPLFTVLDLTRVEIPVSLPARRYPDVKPGAGAVVMDADTGAELWRGAVARVAPTINERERTFFVYLIVDGDPTRNPVPPGTHVLAEIQGQTYDDVVVVPREAFVSGVNVYVVKPDPDAPTDTPDRYVLAERREPRIVRLLTAIALVRDGLADGEEYVVTNLESVADGSRLRVAPEAPASDGK